MKQLISLNGDGNKVRFIRGDDSDICITFDIPEKKIYSECVRVGPCHSGGQYVPPYVKQALHRIVDALDRWDKEQDEPYKMSHDFESISFDVSERILQYGEGAGIRENTERVINARNTMRFISTSEIPHPPVDNLSGESEYVLTYAGKRLLPIVAQYCTPPFGTGRKKSHWRDTHFKPLVIEPLYWAYIDYPDCPRESLEAENTEYDYGHNVKPFSGEDN